MHTPTLYDRRRFLKRAAWTIATPLASATLLRTALHAAPDTPRAAASDRITVGLIGAGKRGHTLLRKALSHPQVQVVAVAEVEGTRREHARGKIEERYAGDAKGTFTGCKAYVDFRELLARQDIDAVIIATPDHWHAIPVNLAAAAKKDIYCEKPLSLTIREAQLMTQAVAKHGVVFQTGSQQRSEFSGRFHRACELVRNGRIGRVHTVLANVGGPSVDCDLPTEETPPDTDWDLWLGPAPRRGYSSTLCPQGMHDHFPAWRNYKEYSGGMMTDWGAHHFDIAQWGLGMDESGPVEVLAPEGKRKRIAYVYANGAVLHHSGGANGVKFIGEDGWIEVNRGHFATFPESIAQEKIGDGETRLYKAEDQMKNWVECVRSRAATVCPAEVGARSATVCHLGNLAYWHKRSLRWDPAAWRFVDDPEANSWLDRPRRGPWHLET